MERDLSALLEKLVIGFCESRGFLDYMETMMF
jgi:hypothetical protein